MDSFIGAYGATRRYEHDTISVGDLVRHVDRPGSIGRVVRIGMNVWVDWSAGPYLGEQPEGPATLALAVEDATELSTGAAEEPSRDICAECEAACTEWQQLDMTTSSRPMSSAEIRYIQQSGRDAQRLARNSVARIIETCRERHF